jgi:hypothetical protein
MRSRHPDLYSDSETVSRPQLTEDILEVAYCVVPGLSISSGAPAEFAA